MDTRLESVAIIVPMLNEREQLPDLLEHLLVWQQQGCEVVLVDGGSQDGSAQVAEALGFTVLHSPKGRAVQMNLGVHSCKASTLLFLHADTRLPIQALEALAAFAKNTQIHWGRFDVRLAGKSAGLPMVAAFMNARSRLTGIATGDQAIFVKRTLFNLVGGFKSMPLMEDIALSKSLKAHAWPLCLKYKVSTSGRRWDEKGLIPTILLMWQLRWRFWRGDSPEQLAQKYR
jgi:rSAM/selenodomain-associated transferase 2